MKDLIRVDPKTGERENLGLIEDRRSIGTVRLWLTHDVERRMWWIAWRDEGGVGKCGYVETRRDDCWDAFYGMTEIEIALLRSS